MSCALIRPPDMPSADLGFAAILSSIYLLFFVSYSPSLWNGTQPKPATCSEVSAIWKCMSEIWGISSPKSQGPKNHLFRRLCNLTANLTAYMFGIKNDIHNEACALETIKGLLHRLKMSWTLVHKQLKLWPSFYPPSVKSTFYFIVRLRRWRWANVIQPNIAKR